MSERLGATAVPARPPPSDPAGATETDWSLGRCARRRKTPAYCKRRRCASMPSSARLTGGIRPYAPCHGRHTRALVLGHTCAIQCNLKWAYVYHGPRGAYMLMNTLSMVLRRFPNPFRRHSLYNTATRAAPCSSQRATTPIHTPLNQRRIELETRHRTRIRAPPSSAFLLKISKCPTHFARASRRATTRCLRRFLVGLPGAAAAAEDFLGRHRRFLAGSPGAGPLAGFLD